MIMQDISESMLSADDASYNEYLERYVHDIALNLCLEYMDKNGKPLTRKQVKKIVGRLLVSCNLLDK